MNANDERPQVAEALRPQDRQGQQRVVEAKAKMDRSYAWLARRIGAGWAVADTFSMADCAAAPALFYADWVHPISAGTLNAYRVRLLARPSVARVVDEARLTAHFSRWARPIGIEAMQVFCRCARFTSSRKAAHFMLRRRKE